jgi:hypothetical protein
MRHSPGMTFSRAIRSTFFVNPMRRITRRMPAANGLRERTPDDRLRIEPGISRFPDAQLRI